jgi:transposase-like protein
MSSDVRKQRRNAEKERFWRGQVRGHAKSGLSVRAWCHEHQLSEPSFYAWRRELAERDAERPAPAIPSTAAAAKLLRQPRRAKGGARGNAAKPSGFLPVTLTQATNHVELELPSGLVIRVPAEPAALRAVWELLEEQRPC